MTETVRTIFISGPTNASVRSFTTTYLPAIERAMLVKGTEFWMLDQSGIALQAARHLSSRGYQKCTILHFGSEPRRNPGRFPTQRVSTQADLEALMILNSVSPLEL